MKLLKAEAGVNDGKAGLLSAAGLFAKGGIFDKKSESFNIQELDPYLLFDARSSMLGTLENPTLDLDPATPSTLDVITATRAGIATYTDPDGLIATASADTVRVDYTQGAELTPTKFQNIGQTDFSSGWANYNSTTTTGSGFESQPSRIVEGTVSNSNNYYFPVTTVDSQLYTYSLYVRRVSGTSSVSLVHTNSPTGAKTLINPSSEWQRFSAVFEGVSGGGTSAVGIEESLAGDSVEIAMPQVEEGTTASDFVENTTGSPKFITGATYGPRVPMILVEPSATNLVTYSEDFSDSSWLKNAVGTGVAPAVTLNAAESPDGTQNATKVVFDSGSGTTSSDLSIIEDFFNTTGGVSYTQSIYLKGENGGEKILLRNAGNSAYTTVTLTTDWARYEVTETANLSFGYFSMGLRQGLGGVVINSSITVYAYGAQVETGSVATSLIPTAGGDAAARTRAADDLQIERDSTNLVPYSEDFTQTSWTKQTGTTVTANTAETTSPTGSSDASKVISDGSNGILDSSVGSGGGENTKSVWLKGVNGGEQVVLKDPNQTITQKTLTLTTEWVRYSLTETQTASFGIWIDDIPATGIYMWGTQLETGDLTSYIPTSGAAASRTTFSDFYNQSEGTVYVEAASRKVNVYPRVFKINGVLGSEYFEVALNSTTVRCRYDNATNQVDLYSGDVSDNTFNKIAVSYRVNDFLLSVDGGASLPDTNASLFSATSIRIGNSGSSTRLNGHIKRLLFWPTHSSRL